jgi:hypothetical protein
MKTFLKLSLSVIVYNFIFILANAILPFSQGFRELGASENPMGLLFMLIASVWVCFTIYYIIKHSYLGGIKLFLNILFVLFFVQCFMTQIETLFFGEAFPVLTKSDVIFIIFAGIFPLLATIPLLIKFFQNKDVSVVREKIKVKSIVLKLGIIGIIYLFVYMLFGYFVAWQFEELRLFYSGSSEKLSFWGQLVNNMQTNPVIYPFQVLRGILFGVFIIPLISTVNKSKIAFVTSVCLVYLCTAILLIIPNALFPDTVRLAHLIEMTSSMLLFGIIAGNILWCKCNKSIDNQL